MKKENFNFLKQYTKDYRFWIKMILGWSQILTIFVFISNTYIRITKGWGSAEYYLVPAVVSIFLNLSFFTTLSNIFCGVFFIFSAFYHHLEGRGKFNNDNIAKIVVTYITLTLILFNIDQIGSEKPYKYNHFVEYLSLIFEHTLGPIVAILYYIFLYNHTNTSNIQVFSKKYLWHMVAGLVGYGLFFWCLGFLCQHSQGLGFYYWNGAVEFGQGSYFVYPFLDFGHKPYFFKYISGAAESSIMLSATLIFAVSVAYFYSFLAIKVKDSILQEKLFIK